MTPTGPALIFVALQMLMAVGLIAVGSWGRRDAPSLVPSHLSEEEREHRVGVMRRGSVACLVVGWILAGTVLWAIVAAIV
ncbi:MAG: hypothetical protein EON52_01405 [Actinomycetales bacterium]|nr:MAG: hypothetical protein EON52_01405 [Actinomycetales bacterium]